MRENKHFVDGIDLWTYYGVSFEKGSYNDFLRIPKRKASIEHNWMDENGLDVDLTRAFYEAKDIAIKCFIIADNETQFWQHYNQFITLMTKPGLRRMTVTELQKDFYVYYRDNNIYDKVTRLHNNVSKVAAKFTLSVTEKVPGFNNTPTFIIDENNRFLIT